MSRHLLVDSRAVHRGTPLGAAGRGIVAGLAGTVVLSLLSRVLPGMRTNHPSREREPGSAPAFTLAPALTIPQSPGPEGLAEQLAYKVGSGVFGVDLMVHTRIAGRAIHYTYGSAWGLIYGLFQASYPIPPALTGLMYGLLVWSVGPAMLGPRMQLLNRPSQEPPERNTSLVAGHLAYGLGTAFVFDTLQRKAR